MGSDWLPFGILRRPHGTKGEVFLHPHNGPDGRSDDRGLSPRVRIVGAEKARELLVAASRPVPGGYLVRFEGVADREAVAALVGQEVHVPRRWLAPLGTDEFFVEDLAGCEVLHPDGRRLGRVRGTFWNGAQDIMAVVAEDGAERLFPVVAEYVLRFDSERRLLIVEPHD